MGEPKAFHEYHGALLPPPQTSIQLLEPFGDCYYRCHVDFKSSGCKMTDVVDYRNRSLTPGMGNFDLKAFRILRVPAL